MLRLRRNRDALPCWCLRLYECIGTAVQAATRRCSIGQDVSVQRMPILGMEKLYWPVDAPVDTWNPNTKNWNMVCSAAVM